MGNRSKKIMKFIFDTQLNSADDLNLSRDLQRKSILHGSSTDLGSESLLISA